MTTHLKKLEEAISTCKYILSEDEKYSGVDEKWHTVLEAAKSYHAMMTRVPDWEKFIVEIENATVQPAAQNALDALDRLYNLELAYEERRALYEAVRTALKQSSAEVVTVEEFYKIWDKNPNRTAAENIMWSFPSGLKIIRSEK